jgi:hypothetical protein
MMSPRELGFMIRTFTIPDFGRFYPNAAEGRNQRGKKKPQISQIEEISQTGDG